METKPTDSEKLFLSLGYNRFYDLFEEIMDDKFWKNDSWIRFSKVTNIFAVYSELLYYEPIKFVLNEIKKHRPPMESEIGELLFKFIRNTLSHFPLFKSWNDVWLNRTLVNWQREGLSIDKFLVQYTGHEDVKYRFWEENYKKMTYISICLPKKYGENKIYLKDIISEKDRVKFALIMMRNILNTQVESMDENK